MKKYLLLRDNKQSGPYSVEELVAKGIKPYDLVWLEGKSAAWRYPSELEELKPFAPVVEEQPYDRFYKKTAQGSAIAATENDHGAAQEIISTPVIPVVATKPVQPAASRKIYVTLPAAIGKTSVNTTTAVPKKETYIPVEKEIPVAKVEVPVTKPVLTVEHKGSSFAAIVDQQYQPKETAILPALPRKQKTDTYKLLLRSIVAACLLLGGVVIGIAITYGTRNNGNQVALDRLVQQLQEKEKQKQQSPTVLQPAASGDETATQPTASNTNTASLAGTVSNGKSEKAIMPAQKEQRKLSTAQPMAAVEKTPDVKIVPAVVTQPQEEKNTPPHSQEHSSPANRESLYRQVAVEASTFKTGVLGGISELYFTISNKSPFPLDQVEVEIKYLGPEKRVVKVQRLLFNDLAAGARKTLEAPRTSRGVTIDYVITKINAKALGIARAGS